MGDSWQGYSVSSLAMSSTTSQVSWQTAVDYFLPLPVEVLRRIAKLYYIGKDKHIYAEVEHDPAMMAEYMGDNVWATGLDDAFTACSSDMRREMLEVLAIERTMNTVTLLRDAAIEHGIDLLLECQSIKSRVHFYQALGLSLTKDGRVGMHAAILELGLVAFFSMRSFSLKCLQELLTMLHLPIPESSKKRELVQCLVNYRPTEEEEEAVDTEEVIQESFQPEIVIDMDEDLEDMTLFLPAAEVVTEREIWRDFFVERYSGTVNVPMVAIFKEMKAFMREHPNLIWDQLLGDSAAFHSWFGRAIKPLLLEMKMERGDSPTVGMLCTFPSHRAHYFCCPQCRKGFPQKELLSKHLDAHRRSALL